MAATAVLPDILFVPEVAEHLRRSVDSVRWLINTKQLKAAKLGGRVVVRRSDLEKFINDAFAEASLMSTAGKAFNAYQFANCDGSLTIGDTTIRISRKVARSIIPLLSVREHEGHMFAAEMKADEQ